MRNTMKNFMLGTALVVGLLGTGAMAANAQPGFGGRPAGRPEPVVGRGFGGVHPVGPERGFNRGYIRGGGYGYGYGYGVTVGTPYVADPYYADAYIPPCPGVGYVWLNGAWIFRGGPGIVRGVGYGRGFDRGFDRGYDRGFDRGGRGFGNGGRGFEQHGFAQGRR